MVHVFNKHSLGTYYKLTTLGTRARGVKKTDLILALQGYNLEGDTDYHSSKYITMACGLTEEIVVVGNTEQVKQIPILEKSWRTSWRKQHLS